MQYFRTNKKLHVLSAHLSQNVMRYMYIFCTFIGNQIKQNIMNKLGYKKHIIETADTDELYAILVINEHESTARLDYYNKGIAIDDLDGFMMFCERMVNLAEVICADNHVELITY